MNQVGKDFCIPESFNTNISLKLFDYTITFTCHSTRAHIQNGSLFLKTCFKRSLYRFLVYKNKSDLDLVGQIQLISIKGQNFPTTKPNLSQKYITVHNNTVHS